MRLLRRPRTLLAVLTGVAFLHGLAYVPLVSPHETPDSYSYEAVATAIAGGSYSTRLEPVDITGRVVPAEAVGTSQRETYRTPGYPLFLALLGGGGGGTSQVLVFLVQALLVAAVTLAVAALARSLWGESAGLVAAALWAFDPFSKRYVSLVLTEVLATALAAAAALLFVRAWRGGGMRAWAGCGAAAAALALVRPVFLLTVPLATLAALVAGGTRGARVRRAAACGAAGAILLAPWLTWNGAVSSRVSMSSFGEGWNLLLAAHGEGLARTAAAVSTSPAFRRDFDSVHRLAPPAAELRRDREAQARYLARADAEQRRLALERYRRRARHEPAAVAGEVAYRSYFLWNAHEDWYQPSQRAALLVLRLLDWAVLALAIGGVLVALRGRGAGGALALFALAFTLLNATHHVEARYGYPLRWLLLAFAALGLRKVVRRLSARRRPHPAPA